MNVAFEHFFVVSSALFAIGVVGILVNRRNLIAVLMSLELILLSVNLNLVTFSSAHGQTTGTVVALFVLTVAAAEAAIGLAILVVYFRRRGTIAGDEINVLRG